MSVVKSSLSEEQQRKLLSLFGHARLHLLYKASVHGFTAAAFHSRCDRQGPTVIVAYNAAKLVFGAYTSKDYTQSGKDIEDKEAFVYSIRSLQKPRRWRPIGKKAFTDADTGPDYGDMVFLHNDKPLVQSIAGVNFFDFDAAAIYGNTLNNIAKLTEFEVYRVDGLGDLLPKPWRNIQWTVDKKQQLMRTIHYFKPDTDRIDYVRILLVGPVGAGKSSFFNSINSVFRGNMTCRAIAGTAGKSVTTQFRTYNIKAGKGGATLPLILCDTMGLEEKADAGLDIEDLVSIYKGHVKDRYQFSPSAPLQRDAPSYNHDVTLNDKIHCVVYVIDTCKISFLTKHMLDKFAAIREKTNLLGVLRPKAMNVKNVMNAIRLHTKSIFLHYRSLTGLPQILLMTKIDEACPLVAENIQNVYRSVNIQRMAQELSESLGIPLSSVLPVKNYSKELELDESTDILLLTAVEHMLNYADSFFEDLEVL